MGTNVAPPWAQLTLRAYERASPTRAPRLFSVLPTMDFYSSLQRMLQQRNNILFLCTLMIYPSLSTMTTSGLTLLLWTLWWCLRGLCERQFSGN